MQYKDAIVEVDGSSMVIEGFDFDDCYSEDDIYDSIVDFVMSNINIEVIDAQI